MIQGKEILAELKSVVSGKTLDALLPPLIFVLINGISGLDIAIIMSMGLALMLGVIRLIRKQAWQYALGGLLGVGFASGLAYLTGNAANFFIPAVLSSGFLSLLALTSLLLGKPLAAWGSHLSRGWPLGWFWRYDVIPAYREVTWLWTAFLLVRLSIQILILQRGNVAQLAWASTVLGWPVTLPVLILSYVYGIWRLRQLGGPGVEEYLQGKNPPWQGQVRGF